MAPFLSDLEAAQGMMRAGDHQALRKMEQAKRLFATKAGVTVFVVERYQNNIQVRPKGETRVVWMAAYAVECPITVTRKGK